MKNNTTPRTLADCEFTTGYTQASRSNADAIVVIGSVIAAAALAVIMVIYG